jgi:hypothetical protein
MMSMAAVSRVSPVFFLKAKPSTVIFLPATLSNRLWIIFLTKRFFWYSLIKMTYATPSSPGIMDG